MRRLKLIVVLAALCVAYSGTALAVGFRADSWVYDPTGTGLIEGAWVPGDGLPDAGNSNHALYLQKSVPTSTVAAGGASIAGVEGIVLTEIGWDIRTDGHCGAGAPRFNVETSDGVNHFIGCSSPAPSSVSVPAPGWETRQYDPATAFPPIAPESTVLSIDIVFDEGTDVGPGYVYLDNITINGVVIGKPGNAK